MATALAVGITANVAAQERFDRWTTENGLPQNSVNDILETRDGYLWAATHGGLVRFDGVQFTVFDASVDGIRSQRIRVLHEDRNGVLWAATEDGMLIRYRDGRFHTYTSADGLPFAAAASIEEDAEGTLWIQWVGVMTRFDGRRFVNLTAEHFANRVAVPPLTRYTDRWWSRDAAGVQVLVKGQVVRYAFDGDLAGAKVTGVRLDSSGNLWMETAGEGAVKLTNGRIQRYTVRDGLPGNDLDADYYADSRGAIWINSRHGGVYRVSNGRRELLNLPQIRAFHEDREGSIWIGTLTNGLHRLRETKVTMHTEGDGLSLKNAYSILQDGTRAIWVGHEALKKYSNGRITSYGSADGLSSIDVVTGLYNDRAGILWVGTSQGLTRFDNGHLVRYDHPSGLLAGPVRAMLEDSTGAMWFATDRGLVERRGGRFRRYTTADGLPHDRITALLETRAGVLWVGSFQGLARLEDGRLVAYTEKVGFVGNQVRALHEDWDGVLWIGTYDGGLYRLHGDRLTRYTRAQGLHDNGVFQILEDDDGYLWMGSNRGIYRVSRHELNEVAAGRRSSVTSLALGVTDGLISTEVNGGQQPSGLKDPDGRLWFPTFEGLAVVNPADFRAKTPPPRTIIEGLRLAGAATSVSGEVTIPADAPYFEIQYTAPTFIKPEQVKFRYKLVGLDDEWVDVGVRRTATLYRVPPGRYRFVVTAASPDGVWDAEGASLPIVVLPPFWRTWWFASLGGMACALLVATAHRFRVGRLRRRHALQEAFSQQLIDSQERERRRISEDLHDSVGQHVAIIKKRAHAGHETSHDARIRTELDEIALLANHIDADINEIAQGLRPYHLDKIGLAKSIVAMVSKVGTACDVEFTTDIAAIDDLFPERARIHIYRIVQECVSNIVKHADASRGSVTIVKTGRAVEICVEDNGKGFNLQRFETAKGGERRFGLIGLHERARMLGGTMVIRSGPSSGTTVTVTLPVLEASSD